MSPLHQDRDRISPAPQPRDRGPGQRPIDRRRWVQWLADHQEGVVSRTQLYTAGISRAEVRANLRASRWRRIGVHCVVVHTGPISDAARHWAAVLEAGPRAYLDGESALLQVGLRHFDVDQIRVSVPRGARIRHRGTTTNIRQTRRWQPDDVEPVGLPRARPAVAAVRAALWARSNRQATLVLTMAVQQRLVTVEELAREMLRVRRDRRRALIHGTLIDLAGGVGSLGELDVVRGCRERGLPIPDQQAVRRTSKGSHYLDFRWRRYRVVLEVDGIQHAWAENVVGDALRHNTIAMSGDVVLRLPVLGLRVCPDEFFAQITEALRAAGWQGQAVA